MPTRWGKIRLFLGVKVAMATVKRLAEAAEAMRSAAYDGGYQIRWVAPATYHVTLKFFGWCDPEVITATRDLLEPVLAGIPSFEFTTRGLGAFPSEKNARVIWAGIDDPGDHLTTLAAAIEDHMGELGFAREKRPFHPHVTLGRVKRVDDVSSILQGQSEQNFSTTRVDRVTVFESIMKSAGSEYTTQAELPLSKRRGGPKRQTDRLKEHSASTSQGHGQAEDASPDASTGAFGHAFGHATGHATGHPTGAEDDKGGDNHGQHSQLHLDNSGEPESEE